jgi:alcohol dehydrogenase
MTNHCFIRHCRQVDESSAGDMMMAAHYRRHGQPRKVVEVGLVPKPPAPGPGELLVNVHAASLNPADWKSAQGEQRALIAFAWPRVYGFDFSGQVVAVGPQAFDSSGQESFSVGDDVFGMIRGLPQANRGTLAEYAIVDAQVCARKPTDVPHSACASVPLVSITAVKMLRACGFPERGRLDVSSGPRVLITGGAGGMGTIAIQLALKMFGASFVATTASAGAKTELCQRLGASRVVNYRGEDFSRALANSDESQLFDGVLDCTAEAKKCVPLLRRGGTLVSILAGPTQDALMTWLREARMEPADITTGVRPFLQSGWGGGLFQAFSGARSLRKACEARGAHFAHVIGTGNGGIMTSVAALLASEELSAVVDREFPLSDAVAAIEYQASGRAAGKVVVTIKDGPGL